MSGFPYKKILVLGATSGIGEGLAAKFVQEGHSVIVVGRRKENLDAFVSKHGSEKASSYTFDVTQLASIQSFVEKVTKEHPDLDSVIMNSGIQRSIDFSKPEDVDLSVVELEFTTNYLSCLYLTNAFLPFLKQASESRPCSVMYTTSGLALVPMPRCPNYCASKAALHHWILSLRYQLSENTPNLKVIEILPPAVQTELHDAKHQPNIKNGRSIGMPLDEFIDETWEGLTAGKDQIPVGMSKTGFAPDGFETKRQEAFKGMVALMKKQNH